MDRKSDLHTSSELLARAGLYQLILSWQKQLIFFHQLIQISFINSFNSFILASPTHSTHSKNELVVNNSFLK